MKNVFAPAPPVASQRAAKFAEFKAALMLVAPELLVINPEGSSRVCLYLAPNACSAERVDAVKHVVRTYAPIKGYQTSMMRGAMWFTSTANFSDPMR